MLLLPFLGLLAVCVIYLMFDIIEGFRKDGVCPEKLRRPDCVFRSPGFPFSFEYATLLL